jgi:hypothetical protein
VRAIKESESNQKSLGSESNQGVSQHEVLAGSTGHASKEAQQTDAGNSIITDEQRMLCAVPSKRSSTTTGRIGDHCGGST